MNANTALTDNQYKAGVDDIKKGNGNHFNRDLMLNQSATPTSVLIADGNIATRSILRDLLHQQAYEVAGEATGWGNFLPMVKRLKPDIICLDQSMPSADIPHFLRDLQTTDPKIAVIVMSSDPATQGKAVAAGATGFLAKPFSQVKVIEELTRVDQARRLLHEIRVRPTDTCRGLRVVLADDSSILRQLLKTILEGMGAEIVGEANDGQQAVIMAAQQQPDLICLDVEMPTMSGIDALARIHAEHPGIKAVMVTSRADRCTVMRAISLGACGYILKPYKPDQVEITLRKVVGHEPKLTCAADT